MVCSSDGPAWQRRVERLLVADEAVMFTGVCDMRVERATAAALAMVPDWQPSRDTMLFAKAVASLLLKQQGLAD